MDVSRLLLSVVMVMSTSDGRPAPDSSCFHLDQDKYKVIKGEAFYYVPYDVDDPNLPDANITWYKNDPEVMNITTDETHRIHYHGGALFFLNISANDAGYYAARHIESSGECFYYHLKIEVFSETSRENLTYGPIRNSNQNKNIPCPDPVKNTCETFDGNFTWFKGKNLIPGQHKKSLWINDATKDDEDIYTCICTWTHNHKVYNSSGSRRLFALEKAIYEKVKIISPNTTEQLVKKGSSVKLNCTVYCGINAERDCKATWLINGNSTKQMDGYSETTTLNIENLSKRTFSTATLTIPRVSAKDFHNAFTCEGSGFYTGDSTTLTLKKDESLIVIIVFVVVGTCLLLITTVVVKYYLIDLTLLIRPYLPTRRRRKTDRMKYDAYVVYQPHRVDIQTEDPLLYFVSKTLPSVLEYKYGFRLFIQGRDDLSWKAHQELMENHFKQSRRLIAILRPGLRHPESSGIHPTFDQLDQISTAGGLDWQAHIFTLAIHHALLHKKMRVILIQLGDMEEGDYVPFHPGLQQLIQKSGPIKWPHGSQEASKYKRFWKRVRYLMPARPARQQG